MFSRVSEARIAVLTWAGNPDLPEDDRALVRALEERGAKVSIVLWDDASLGVNGEWDVILMRAAWDYHLRANEFFTRVASWELSGARVFNPPAILRWNADKRYLLELEREGLAIVPSRLARAGVGRFEDVVRGWSHEEWVVKPTVSASAFETHKGSTEEIKALWSTLGTRLLGRDVLIQPYIREVQSQGELSIVLIAGEFSHAVIKRPTAGDYRVQGEYGGTWESYAPSEGEVEFAKRAQALAARLHGLRFDSVLYARVDLMPNGDLGWQLGELELIEPALGFSFKVGSADVFAEALSRKLESF